MLYDEIDFDDVASEEFQELDDDSDDEVEDEEWDEEEEWGEEDDLDEFEDDQAAPAF